MRRVVSVQVMCGLFCLLASGVLSGCSDGRPERVRVSGKVTIDGQPLTVGFVQVVPQDARPASGKIGSDGRFTLTTFNPDDGVVPGKHRAAVIALESIDASSQRWHAPKEYAAIESSGLEVDVPKATTDLEIKLTWKGGKPFVERFGSEGPR